MTTKAIPFLLIVSACSSDVNLELETAGRKPIPPGGLVDDSPQRLGDLAWVFTDPGLEGSGVTDLAWAPDGALIVGGKGHWASDPVGPIAFISKLGADGAPLWLREIALDDLLDQAEACCGLKPADVEVTQAASHIEAIDVYPDGEVVVAAQTFMSYYPVDDAEHPQLVVFAFLHWYGPDGELGATRAFPATASSDRIYRVSNVLALPDGGTALTAHTGTDNDEPTGSLAARLDADGEIVWTTPVDSTSFRTFAAMTDLISTHDGGIAVQGRFGEDVAVGGCTAGPSGGTFVARLDEQDGSCTWLRIFAGADTLPARGGLAIAPGGSLIAAGPIPISGSVRAGDLELVPDSNGLNWSFISELAADGQVLTLNLIERLPPVLAERNRVALYAMSVVGDAIATAGYVEEYDADSTTFKAHSAFVAQIDRSGNLLAARRMEPSPPTEDDYGLSKAVALHPEGGVAVGGQWQGDIDFGDGTVFQTADPSILEGFVALYDLDDDPVSVDLVPPGR